MRRTSAAFGSLGQALAALSCDHGDDDLLTLTVETAAPIEAAPGPSHGSHSSHASHASHHSMTHPGHTSHASHASHHSSR